MSALIYCPFPDSDAAETVASRLLDEKLVACANMGGPVRSLFEFGGERGEGEEFAVLFKTHASLLEKAVIRLEQLHPYDCPAVLGWVCEMTGPATRDWLGALVGADAADGDREA